MFPPASRPLSGRLFGLAIRSGGGYVRLWPSPSAEPIASLYVHVPFCARKCLYCAFYSEPSSGELIDRYVGALIRELERVAADLKPRTIFFGGGTPSLLNLRQWERIFRAMERLPLSGRDRVDGGMQPGHRLPRQGEAAPRPRGVNRISLGVQSFNETLLDRLGRVHSRQMAFDSFDILRQAGFDNLNLDLMFAIPGQTLEVWRETLAEAAALGSEHLSTYEVIYEEDTPLYDQLQAGKVDVDEDLACAMYEELVERAANAGFQQYEVANFARWHRNLLNPQPSTDYRLPQPLPASTTSITGGEAPFTGWARARPPTFGACAPRTAPTRSSTASNSNKAGARSNRASNWPRWPAPGRPPPLACGWSPAGPLSSSSR